MNEKAEVEKVLRQHFIRYPEMQPQDVVKLLFQNEFGSGHMLSDKGLALARLTEEFMKTPFSSSFPMTEEIGNGVVRLNLAAMTDGILSAATIFRLFLHCAERAAGTILRFEQKIDVLQELCALGETPFDEALLAGYLRNYRVDGYHAVSHSEKYRLCYHPAYRLVQQDDIRYFSLFREIDRRLDRGEHVLLAIDGQAASGKSTLASRLAQLYDANIIHMDHFFLPLNLRTPERFCEPGGNVHYERVEKEVLQGLKRGGAFSYRVFNCCKMDFDGSVTISPKSLNIIEGSYSMHPRLCHDYDLSVFLTVNPQEQKERIIRRDGKKSPMFLQKWIPLEESYFAQEKIKDHCDFCFINE